MTFPHNKLDLEARLSQALEGQREGLLQSLAEEPHNTPETQEKPKESPGEVQEEPTIAMDEGHWVVAKKGNPGSFLINPPDRDRFINWGKKPKKKT